MSLIGHLAPAFILMSHEKKRVDLADFAGKKLVLAFYPGAFTGVCTKEMCALQDGLARFGELDATVVGISVDSIFANAAFAAQNGVTFPLLSDHDRAVTTAYGVAWPNFGGMTGYTAANRSVFIVGRDGIVTWAWIAPNPGVEPDYDNIAAALAA